MAKFLCKCGETLSNTMAPNDVELKVFTDKEWDQIISVNSIDPLTIPSPMFDVWRCPNCERLYVFRKNEDTPYRRYLIETD